MITPNQVLETAKALEASGGTLAENITALDVTGVIQPALLDRWRAIAQGIGQSRVGAMQAIDALGDTVDFTKANGELSDEVIRIRITKNSTATTFYFFTSRGLSSLLSNAALIPQARRIFVAGEFTPFNTESCSIQPWSESVDDNQTIVPLLDVVPRRFVKDLIGGKVPTTIGHFLLAGAAPDHSEVFETWKAVAAKEMLRSLVDEIWQEAGIEMVQLSGPRRRRIVSGLNGSVNADVFEPATEAARWVYASGREIETRHTLLTYELARDWPDEIEFANGFATRAPRALDAAKISFQSYIREISKDTLKSLSDLRKTLSEEVAKVSAQTRDLLSTMWRDFVVAVTAVIGRIALLLADKPAADSIFARGMLWATALFIGSSLSLTIYSNWRFMKVAETNRTAWRTKLYGFLPTSDLEGLWDNPIKESIAAYRNARSWIIVLYAFLVAVLVAASLPSLHHDATVQRPGNATTARPTPSPTATIPPTPRPTATVPSPSPTASSR